MTDWNFFAGTIATVNSVLEFPPLATVYVIQNERRPLSGPQAACLGKDPRMRLLGSSEFCHTGRYIDAWEIKAYAMAEREEHDVLVGIDSDCILCSNVDVELRVCLEPGGFLGGKYGDGAEYDAAYAVYGIAIPARNELYMSTSLYFCAVCAVNIAALRRWAECCTAATFNGQGPYPGHGDQGVLNAVLFAADKSVRVQLLDNALWSQHWSYWESRIDFRDGAFVNQAAGSYKQRAFHCGGSYKYWSIEHRDRVFGSYADHMYPYVWFLAMLWLGKCGNGSVHPCQYLPPSAHHLADDLVHALPQIMQVYPPARQRWERLGDHVIERVLDGIPRAMSLHGGSLRETMELVSAFPAIRRYVEIGGYEGGSILALGLHFANRDIHFYSVESFTENHDGTMDGHRLASRVAFLENLERFPSLAANLFSDRSIDMLFIDPCHETNAVLHDIDGWIPKLAPGAIVAGDNFGWPSVAQAVSQRFADAHVTPPGYVWWTELP